MAKGQMEIRHLPRTRSTFAHPDGLTDFFATLRDGSQGIIVR